MKPFLKNVRTSLLATGAAAMVLFSCNKTLPVNDPTMPSTPPGSTILQLLDAPNFSLLKTAVNRVPALVSLLGSNNSMVTVFAPDNDAFATIGITSNAQITGMPIAQLTAILNYHLIGGMAYNSAAIPDKFPNMYMQSMLMLAAPSASLPPGYRMPLCPSRRGSNVWANALPIKQPNVAASNGIVHVPVSVLIPPDSVIAQIVAADPSYAYLLSAIVRADSGVAAPNRLIDALATANANFTLMAPTNEAFQQTLTFLITQALVGQGLDPATALATAQALASTPAVFQNPALFGALPAQTVRGVVAYHVIGRTSATNATLIGRVFSVNIPSASTNVNTLLQIAPNTPPLPVAIQNTGAAVTVKGLGNPAPANVTVANKNCINGVIHRINGVLLPPM